MRNNPFVIHNVLGNLLTLLTAYYYEVAVAFRLSSLFWIDCHHQYNEMGFGHAYRII
ncbi:protein of unknown function [Candidatus Nitrosocosmicus franklandus]|uniref:Uncharacterized protein n=1 Tax=Candidatus Nitrosocosmicus franklandianus TaxID=1798806 RepID=A0A484IEM9_9ARCH|nr:protein of unknown function [Candidatus Nitrosocosmicus franklandus]